MEDGANCISTVVTSANTFDALLRYFKLCSLGSVTLAVAQFALALIGLSLSLRAFPTAPGCQDEFMCMTAWSFWVSPPAFFWSGVTALATWRVNTLRDSSGKSLRRRGRLLALAGDANLLLVPACMCACLLWAHKAIATHRTVHAALCAVSQVGPNRLTMPSSNHAQYPIRFCRHVVKELCCTCN